jgi:PAS domain S-box-containing protein
MGFKMVMVTSNNTILKYAESIRQEYNYDITFITSEMEDCLEVVRAMFQKEKHFILASRGATASLLRKTFNRPVMEIQVTDYDIMRLIYPVKDRGKRLAIMGYKYVIRRTMKIAELLNIKIVPLEIESSDEIQPSLKRAREDGIEVIIGEGYVSECARDAGFETLHIDYGLETVQAVIEEGKKLYYELEKLSIIDERHSLILESMEEGVIAIDEKERISVFNLAAEKLYECSKEQMIGKPIREVISSTRMPGVLKSGRATMGALLDTGKHVVATNIIPIIVEGEIKGAVSTFRDIS